MRLDDYGKGRQLRVFPAWDCICGPCGVKDCPGHGAVGDRHGRDCEEWVYSIASPDGLTVLSLSVDSGLHLPITPQWILENREARRAAGRLPKGNDLTLHCVFTTDSDGAGSSDTCLFHKPCHAHSTSGLDADAFWRSYGEPGARTPERTETFWLLLEERHAKLDAEARAHRIKSCPDCPPVCATCAGVGFVLDPFRG
jgi:hypothetical protein